MLTVELPAEIEARLDALAEATGRTKDFYLRQAILEHLAGVEDSPRDGQGATDVSEARYRILAENSRDIIFLHDRDGRRSYVSPACRQMLGYEPEELLHLPAWALVHPDDAQGIAAKYAVLSAERPEFASTHRLRRKDGAFIWVEAQVRLIPDAVEHGATVVGTVRDITARRQAEDRLRESEARFRGQFDTAAHGIALVSPEGRWLRANPALCRMLGYAEDALLAADFQSITHPDDLDADLAQVRAMLAGAIETYQLEKRYFDRGGHVIWVLLSVSLVRDADGRPLYFVSQIQDVTDRKRAEEALRFSESRYRTVADNATDMIVLQDHALQPLYISPASRRLLGYEPDELARLTTGALMHPDDGARFIAAITGLSEAAPRSQSTHRLRRRDGSFVWVEASFQLVAAGDDEPGRFVTVVRDITERRQAEEAAVELRRLLDDAIDAMQDSFSLFDAEDRLVVVNTALRRRFVHRPDVVAIGRTYEEIFRSNLLESGIDREALEQRVAAELIVHRRADGTPREVRAQDGTWLLSRQFRTGDGGVLIISTDITARKESEAELLRARRLVVDAIEAMPDAVALYDSEERLLLANRALLKQSARLPDLFVEGARYEDLTRVFWNAHRAELGDTAFEEHIEGRLMHFRLGDGTPFESRTGDGRWHVTRHFRTRNRGTISVSTDITETKQAAAEIEAARDVAEAANKAKSAFLASMSHELRTPLNGVLGFTDLLLDGDLSGVQRRHVRGIHEAGKSLLALINDILDISKIEAGKLAVERVPMSPESIVDGAISILRSQFMEKGVRLEVECAHGIPPWVEGDPTRVRQILLNLLSNALKFTDSGQVVVRLSRGRSDGGALLRFDVEDSGIGIPLDRQHLLFQDFSQIDHSTTRRYGGTGLGLAICKRLAEAMGGEVGVISGAGIGSTFWFTIGLAEISPPDETAPAQSAVDLSPARILVAEDLRMNQLVIEGFLKRAGHDVTIVDDGRAAVAAVESGPFDLVFMDMEMPEMDGLSATRAIRALDGPVGQVPIIALTANALLEDAAQCKSAGMDDFLAKPIDRAKLHAAIARWTRAGRGGNGAVVPPPPRQPVLDTGVLDELEKLFGSESAVEFVDMSRVALEGTLPIFAGSGATAAVVQEAHDLISIAGNVGCLELMQIGRELLDATDDTAKVETIRAEIVAALGRAISALGQRYAA